MFPMALQLAGFLSLKTVLYVTKMNEDERWFSPTEFTFAFGVFVTQFQRGDQVSKISNNSDKFFLRRLWILWWHLPISSSSVEAFSSLLISPMRSPMISLASSEKACSSSASNSDSGIVTFDNIVEIIDNLIHFTFSMIFYISSILKELVFVNGFVWTSVW